MSLFPSDLWIDDPEPLRGEMFIWAYWSPQRGDVDDGARLLV